MNAQATRYGAWLAGLVFVTGMSQAWAMGSAPKREPTVRNRASGEAEGGAHLDAASRIRDIKPDHSSVQGRVSGDSWLSTQSSADRQESDGSVGSQGEAEASGTAAFGRPTGAGEADTAFGVQGGAGLGRNGELGMQGSGNIGSSLDVSVVGE
jgi:hypothetical protein